MKKNITNWMAVLIAFLPLVYLAITWSSLPHVVPVHFGTDMKPDRMGSRWEIAAVAGILAVVSLSVFALFKNLHRIDPRLKGQSTPITFVNFAFGLVIFMAALGCLIVHSVKNYTVLQNLLFPLLGLLFAFIGAYMMGIKPNYVAGFRLPWTLHNGDNWQKTHLLGGKVWTAGGILIAVVCLLLPAQTAFIFFLSAIFMMVIIPVIYSYRLFKKHHL